MNPQDPDLPSSDLPGDLSPAEAAASPKPRRKRAVSVAPVDVSEAPVAKALAEAATVSVAAEPTAEAPAKPKRARRKPAEGLADAGDTPMPAATQASEANVALAPAPVVEAAAAAVAAAPVPAKPRRRTAAAASLVEPGTAAADMVASPTVPLASAAQPAAVDAPPAVATASADSSDSGAPAAAEGAGTQDAEGDAAEGDGARRRNRNRRRGRRGGADRALREDGTPADDGSVAAVTALPGGDDDEDDEPSAVPAADTPRAAPLDAGETFAAVLSGDYDVEPVDTGVPADPEKRVLAAEPDAPKLHKVLAQAGVGSRRDMEELIAEGQVQVNGQVAHTGQRISFGDRISIAGKLIKVRIAPPPPRVIAYHKPVGEVVTNDDPQHRPTVYRRLPRLAHGKWQSVGRLDINTEGLLLFTNSGELANQLMHPRFGVEREYAVRVLGTLEADAKARLLEGVDIDGQRAMFQSIEDGGGEGVNRWYRVVITEGRNREVRKLFDKVGLGVSRLIRIRYGSVVLPRGLRRGLFVDLNEAEVREVRRLASVGRDQPLAAPRPPRPEAVGPREGQAPRDGQSARGGQGPRDAQGPRDSQGPRDGQGPNRGTNNNRRSGPPPQRADRGDRPDREPRPDRSPAGQPSRPQERRERPLPRPPAADGDVDHVNFAAIPNPLMQTFDKRAIREARAPRREIAEDGPIPNPLEQTYDKRFVQKPKGFGIGGGGGGRKGGGGGGEGGGQPDPMKTSLGYIGADAFVRKFQGNGGAGGGGGGGGGGGAGNRGGRRTGGGGGSGGSGGSGGGGGGGGGGRRGGGSR